MIEIERKFRLTPREGTILHKALKSSRGAHGTVRQIDEVFLYKIESFTEFKRGMPVARLRTIGDVTTLTYKRSINDAGDSIEHEVGVASANEMRAILRELGYIQVTVVDKIRLETKIDDMAITHDQVKGLGDFMEIEILATSEADIPQAEKRIMAKAKELGLSHAPIENRKYDQLVSLST
jgi:adenylate cyclase class 2